MGRGGCGGEGRGALGVRSRLSLRPAHVFVVVTSHHATLAPAGMAKGRDLLPSPGLD